VNPPLDQSRFAELKKRLIGTNREVGPLRDMEFGDLGLSKLKDAPNWNEVLQRSDIRFLHEEQVCEYFVARLLDELKDPRTPVLKECWCEPLDRTAERGRADYFFMVAGTWVAVEVKLEVRLAEGLLQQVAKYAHLRGFWPTQGSHAGRRFETGDSSLCVVVDQTGVMLIEKGRFVHGEPGRPAWPRRELTREALRHLREVLVTRVRSS
jgi:hypothetical protein